MVDWDAEGPRLQANLSTVLRAERDRAAARHRLSSLDALEWQKTIMTGLVVPDPAYVGRFRGAPGLETCQVHVNGQPGVLPGAVGMALASFDDRLFAALNVLDEIIPPGAALDADTLNAVIDLCAWAHAEWVRIHPLANGNGRTARMWANVIAMRYGVPPFVALRPRPDGGYGAAAAAAMNGDWRPTAAVFRGMLYDALIR